jgi:predicted nuclease with TOPRIM domain
MTDQRLTNLEKNYSLMNQKQEQILEEIRDIKKNMITLDKMDLSNEMLCKDIFKETDRRYANKLTERIVYVCGGAIGLYVLNNLLELI